jgi:hypothetical protein
MFRLFENLNFSVCLGFGHQNLGFNYLRIQGSILESLDEKRLPSSSKAKILNNKPQINLKLKILNIS